MWLLNVNSERDVAVDDYFLAEYLRDVECILNLPALPGCLSEQTEKKEEELGLGNRF